jgi:hypothetical protein
LRFARLLTQEAEATSVLHLYLVLKFCMGQRVILMLFLVEV